MAMAISKAQNIESQLTIEGVEKGLFREDSEEVSEGSGDNDNDNVVMILEPVMTMLDFSSICMKSLISRQISMMFMSVRLITWTAVQSQCPTALLSKRFTCSKR